MRIVKHLLTVVFLFGIYAGIAQKNYTKEADNAFKGEAYFNAVDLYKKAYTKEGNKKEKIRIIFQIGQCYRLIEEPAQAEVWYSKAIKAKYPDQKSHLYLGDIYRIQGKYEEAVKEYKIYSESAPDDARAKDGISSCEQSQKWMKDPTPHLVELVPGINSKQSDFSPSLLGRKKDEMIFVSNRPSGGGNEIDSRTGVGFEDLFFTEQDRKGKWSVPQPIAEPINSPYNEGSAAVSKRDKNIYYTKCGVEKKKVLGCEIWMATKRGAEWADPKKMELFDDSITVGHPSISADDRVLFFASDAPGGKGGKDIWFVIYDKKEKTWSKPKNAGAINTADDEMFPHIRDNGELYFASNGYAGMGGFDLYKAESTGQDEWGNVENLKYPMNSSANDFGIYFLPNQEKGYFTSDRTGGKGRDDIYSFRMPPVIYTMQGTVKDVDCKTPIAGATVKLIGTDGSSVETTSDGQGFYKFDEKENGERYILENTSYTILVSKSSAANKVSEDCKSPEYTSRGYLVGKGQETTVGIEKSTAFVHDFELQCSNCGDIKFPQVLYKLADWKLMVTPEINSKDSLNDLYQTLIDNPTIVIELSAHTDSRGGEKDNLELSQKRAQSCVDYLVSKGIAEDRMEAVGYGESQLLVTDEDIAAMATKELKEAGHQKNRRTVFKVLRDDYVPKEPAAPEGGEGGSGEGGAPEDGGESGGN